MLSAARRSFAGLKGRPRANPRLPGLDVRHRQPEDRAHPFRNSFEALEIGDMLVTRERAMIDDVEHSAHPG